MPEGRPEKLELIEDAAALLELTLSPPEIATPASDADLVRALFKAAAALQGQARPEGGDVTGRLAAALDALARGSPEQRAALADAITPGLRTTLRQLSEALRARPVTLASMPDEIRRDWIAADGQARVEVAPRDSGEDNRALRRFAAAVQAVAPGASGAPISILAASRTISGAFLLAGGIALVLVAGLLGVALRDLRLVVLGLAPLHPGGTAHPGDVALIGPVLTSPTSSPCRCSSAWGSPSTCTT